MNSGVKVLLAVLILCLALDVTLIVTKLGQSNPESERAGSQSTSADAGNENTASSMIFNFSGAVSGNRDSSSSAIEPDDLSEAEWGAMALSEESTGENEEDYLFTAD